MIKAKDLKKEPKGISNAMLLLKVEFWVKDDNKSNRKETNFGIWLDDNYHTVVQLDWLTSELIAAGYSVNQDDGKYIISWE